MNRFFPYIIAVVAFAALAVLLVSGINDLPKKLNERITLRQSDKIPYGYYAAYKLLPNLFPSASVTTNKKSPEKWIAESDSANQAVVLVGIRFNADSYELEQIRDFVKRGNHVFVIARYLSHDARSFFQFDDDHEFFDDDGLFSGQMDTLQVQLNYPRFSASPYEYPGRRFAGYVSSTDPVRSVVLGKNERNYPNFIQYKIGNGSLYLHVAPLAFSNYFILHKKNIGYFEKAFSVLPPGVKKILWNEYYLIKPMSYPRESQRSWLHVLFRYPAFKWGFLTALATLLLFVLLEIRRRQRMIPVVASPRNESLDFVKTIGRLYYDKGDHRDLARKMANYFLEHVRSRYKIGTQALNEEFVQTLHTKSGYPAEAVKSIADFIHYLETNGGIDEQQLLRFYQQLENFYQNT